MSGLYDEDGIDGPFERGMARPIRARDLGAYCVRRCGTEQLWAVGFWKGRDFIGHSDHESEQEALDCADWLNEGKRWNR